MLRLGTLLRRASHQSQVSLWRLPTHLRGTAPITVMPAEAGTQASLHITGADAWLDPGLRRDDVKWVDELLPAGVVGVFLAPFGEEVRQAIVDLLRQYDLDGYQLIAVRAVLAANALAFEAERLS